MKGIKNRLRLVWKAIILAFDNPKLEMSDTLVLAQWGKANRSFVVTRTINHIIGLMVGQIAIVKNGEGRLNINNEKFVTWVADGLNKALHKNVKNTPPYAHLHVRKVKMRPNRRYR